MFRLSRRGWVVLAVLGLLASSMAADSAAAIGSVRRGVRAGSLELGGKSEDEATALISDRASQLSSQEVEFFGEKERVTLRPATVGFEPDVQATLREAMGVGRVGNFAVRMWHRLRAHLATTDVGWSSTIDREKANKVVKGWAERFDDEGHEAGIRARGARIVPVAPLPGRALDQRRAVGALVRGFESWPRRSIDLPYRIAGRRTDAGDARSAADAANQMLESSLTLEAPDDTTIRLDPRELAPLLEAVPRKRGLSWGLDVRFAPERVEEAFGADLSRFEREPTDARFVVAGSGVNVQASEDGRTFDAEGTADAMTKAARRDSGRNAVVAFEREEPSLTTEEARNMRIRELVSSFTTNHPCCAPRVTNIHKIADIVNNTVIKPGETFSLNQRVGRRTAARGFVLAPMIFDGEYKDDVGGGVSQFATTFFNAVFFGGYQVVSHTPHSYYISRYPPGREATMSWPAPDLRFRNDSNSGILVRTSYSSSSITVSFFGDKEGKVVRSSTGERTNFTEPTEQRKANPALPPGQERVVQSGHGGFDIVVTRTITQNGKSRTQRFFTRYKAEPKIIEVGPGSPRPATPKPGASPGPKATPRPPQTPTPAQ
jgi:vancomycin resistance protein YoaR